MNPVEPDANRTVETPAATTPAAVATGEAATRLSEFTVVDVRSPGEYAGGHLPGAYNVPLERLDQAADALTAAAARGPLLLVCASGNRSARGCARLAARGVEAATLDGGTTGWTAAGHPVERSAGTRAPWPMDRQVRLAAGSLVAAGFVAGRFWRPAHWLSGAIGAGLVFSGITGTCGMAAALARLPHNRPAPGAVPFEETLTRLAA
ncbi:rhodanese-like domain-containing protein [Streptomyces sp. NPDC003730]